MVDNQPNLQCRLTFIPLQSKFIAQFKVKVNLKGKFILFVSHHISRSGSYWENHVLTVCFDPGLEMVYYQCVQRSFLSSSAVL